MTKRDYELIAKAIRKAGERLETDKALDMVRLDGVNDCAHAISEALIDTNPRFDQVRFLTACGVI